MIISHKHKYLFVELPMTGSTAISHELCENYEGISVLKKHSTYRDFLKVATEAEKQYFVFAGIRHPLDQVVSHYFKFKSGHEGQFTRQEELDRHKGSIWHRIAYEYSHISRYRFIQENQADFGTFFLRYYKVPYNNWSSLDHKKFGFVVHFEELADDFARMIQWLGLELKRPLPQTNKTQGKQNLFFEYYDTPELREHAKYIFGPFMQQWGYEFPPEWGEYRSSWRQQTEFKFLNIFRGIYWNYFRRPGVHSGSLSLEETRQSFAEQRSAVTAETTS
jgi:hypothetical protein